MQEIKIKTKDRILSVAMQLFSVKGYHAVSIRDIAGAVGIKESSIYNHFKGKQEIFDTIIQQSIDEMAAYFVGIQVPANKEDNVSMYDGLKFDALYEKISNTFRYYFENENIRMLKNILLISQFDNPSCRSLYKRVFYDEPVAIQTRVFQRMMDIHMFRFADAGQLAVEFYGPVFAMIHLYDTFEDVEALLRSHLRLFIQCFGTEELL